VAKAGEHTMIIERRGRSHQAHCRCGWSGHAWNELRPAEADAWHHVFGESCIVDSGRATAAPAAALPTYELPSLDAAIERLVTRARALAQSSSPYGEQAVGELRRLSGGDRKLAHAAIDQLSELLRRHSRQSKSTADSEWLTLRTARRLLEESLAHEAYEDV